MAMTTQFHRKTNLAQVNHANFVMAMDLRLNRHSSKTSFSS